MLNSRHSCNFRFLYLIIPSTNPDSICLYTLSWSWFRPISGTHQEGNLQPLYRPFTLVTSPTACSYTVSLRSVHTADLPNLPTVMYS